MTYICTSIFSGVTSGKQKQARGYNQVSCMSVYCWALIFPLTSYCSNTIISYTSIYNKKQLGGWGSRKTTWQPFVTYLSPYEHFIGSNFNLHSLLNITLFQCWSTVLCLFALHQFNLFFLFTFLIMMCFLTFWDILHSCYLTLGNYSVP